MQKNISFDELLNKIKAKYKELKSINSLYELIEIPEKFDIFAPEYDGYFSVVLSTTSEQLIQEVIELLKEKHFAILGDQDTYGDKQLLAAVNTSIAYGNKELAQTDYYKQLVINANQISKPYGYDEKSLNYYVYFIPYNSYYPNWFSFRNDIIPELVKLSRKNKKFATIQFHQSDNIVYNKGVLNITVKGDDGNPEYVYYLDNLHVFINEKMEDFRQIFTAVSLIFKISDNQEDFASVCNGIDLINIEEN